MSTRQSLAQRRSAMARPLLAVATLLLVGGLLSALYFSQIEAIVAEETKAGAGSGGARYGVSTGGAAAASRPDSSAVAVRSATIRRGANATSSRYARNATRPQVDGRYAMTPMVPIVTATPVSTGAGDRYEKEAKLKASRLGKLYATRPPGHESPACRPHFQSVDDGASWEFSNATRFRRMAFHHARKAGGTSIADYLVRVAHHYGIEFVQTEFDSAEEPGTADVPTFYVTHLREPVSRSISHFRYQGRWDCRDLIRWAPRSSMTTISISNTEGGEPDGNGDDDDGTRRMLAGQDVDEFTPTLENANPLESWNKTAGHVENDCPKHHFRLGECAIQCYTQWYSGMSCPRWQIPMEVQYQSASAVLFRYNMIIVLEWLSVPEYAEAVERFFGVPGVTKRRGAYCERSSRRADKMFPLVPKNETVKRLRELNEFDVKLYDEITNCDGEGYPFPSIDESRFANTTRRVPHESFTAWRSAKKRAKSAKSPAEEDAIMSEFWQAVESGEDLVKQLIGEEIGKAHANTTSRMTNRKQESKSSARKPKSVDKDKKYVPLSSRTNTVSREVSPAANAPSEHAKYATQDHVSKVVHLRRRSGGWGFDEELAGPSPVVYSFGLGEGIGWEVAMIKRYNVTVFGFDPTPKSEAYVLAQMDMDPIVRDKFLYVKEGLAWEAGVVRFTEPDTEAPVASLDDLMAKLHHKHVDILKLDIEGAEYGVLEDLCARDRLPFTQLLVEWHWRYSVPGSDPERFSIPESVPKSSEPVPETTRHKLMLKKLASRGFKVIESRNGGQETTMIKTNRPMKPKLTT